MKHDNDVSDFLDRQHAQKQRGRDPLLEQLQKQFPGLAIEPFPQNAILVVANAVNYEEEITVPSGAAWFEITSNNGFYVSKNKIFPQTAGVNSALVTGLEGISFQAENKRYLARGIRTLRFGLLNIGDVVSINYHFQLFDSNTDTDVGRGQ